MPITLSSSTWVNDARRVASWLHTLPRDEATASLRLILSSLGKETVLEALGDVANFSTSSASSAASSTSPMTHYFQQQPHDVPQRSVQASPVNTPAGIIGQRHPSLSQQRPLDTLHEEPPLSPLEWRRPSLTPLSTPVLECRSGTPLSRPQSITLESMASLWSSPAPFTRTMSMSSINSRPSVLLGSQQQFTPELPNRYTPTGTRGEGLPPRPRTVHEELSEFGADIGRFDSHPIQEPPRYSSTHRRSRSFHGSSSTTPNQWASGLLSLASNSAQCHRQASHPSFQQQQQHHHHLPNYHYHHNKSEKGKIPEAVDWKLLEDVPGWLRSLRLHKYTSIFQGKQWKEMIYYDDAKLESMGVGALGARRKLIKVFHMIRRSLGEDLPEEEEFPQQVAEK